MADQKISQLAGGGAALATDEIPIARSGANYKITGANIAAAATSVGTLTSLTVSGNVTVNTNTFFVDTVNNRIGIGTVSPTISPLQAEADADANRGLYARNINTGTAAYGFVAAASLVGALELRAYSAANSVWPNRAVLNSGSGFTNGLAIVANGATPIEMWTNGSRRLTVDSAGNLGLGVTPSAWDSANFRAIQISNYFSLTAQTTNQSRGSLLWNAYGTGNETFAYAITGDNATRFSQQYDFRWFTASSGTAGSAITFTERMRLDSSGNLGLGITPSAWESTCRMLQLGANSTVGRANSGETQLGFNYFINSSGQYTYIQSLTALRYEQVSGQHRWYNAPSGTAGNAITFTQAMTLDASGRLGIGTTAPACRLELVFADAETNINNIGAVIEYKVNTDQTNNNFALTAYADAAGGAVSAMYGVQFTDHTNNYGNFVWRTRGPGGLATRVVCKAEGQVRFVPLAAAPTTNVEDGDVYYDSGTNKLRVRAGGAWVDLH